MINVFDYQLLQYIVQQYITVLRYVDISLCCFSRSAYVRMYTVCTHMTCCTYIRTYTVRTHVTCCTERTVVAVGNRSSSELALRPAFPRNTTDVCSRHLLSTVPRFSLQSRGSHYSPEVLTTVPRFSLQSRGSHYSPEVLTTVPRFSLQSRGSHYSPEVLTTVPRFSLKPFMFPVCVYIT